MGWILLLLDFMKDSDGDNQWGSINSTAAPEEEEETLSEKLYRLAQEHEPRNLYTPDGRMIIDRALSNIVPTFSGREGLAGAIMQCNPQDIKANIDVCDKDTLLVISKGLHFYMAQGEERATLSMVLNGVNRRLEELI